MVALFFKRMAKSKYKYKKKFKGVAYIEGVLLKYQSSKFKTKKEAREKAREIYSELKKNDESVIIKNIVSKVVKKRTEKTKLTLPEELTTPQNYFILTDYPSMILTSVSNKIKFVSEVSPKGLEPIQGGSEPSYEEYFSDFVNYCNTLASKSQEGQYEEDWFVRCTTPNNKGVSRIIQCTSDGVEFDYGFDRENPKEKPTESVVSDKPKKEKEITTKEVKEEKPTIQQKIDLEKQYNEGVKNIAELLKLGVYNKEEAKSELLKLKQRLGI